MNQSERYLASLQSLWQSGLDLWSDYALDDKIFRVELGERVLREAIRQLEALRNVETFDGTEPSDLTPEDWQELSDATKESRS